MIPFIDLKTQYQELKQQIQERIDRVLEHGQYIMGPEVAELENKLAEYVGVKYCITASSGTDTLLIAMMALGVGPGDEVITTPFTFFSTAEMVALLGAKPVFVDIDPDTYNIDPIKIEAAITSKTRAIMPVSLYGQCANMDSINRIADNYKIPVIEDAAQSFGATYKNKKSCSLSTIGSTSFFPSKPFGGYGDGGALFTNDELLARVMREIRTHGQDRRYHHPRIGLNGRLDTIQAAILLAKFERFPSEVERREAKGERYSQKLYFLKDKITLPYIDSTNRSVYAQYTIQVDNRDYVAEELSKNGIPYAVHYPIPLSLQPAFSYIGHIRGDFPNAERAALRVISLPMGPDLSHADQDTIVEVLTKIVC
jgi:UDP-2-acetamido-2-deoxy-ribo-hexuluronate aminotransferase